LTLRKNRLGNVGAQAISKALQQNTICITFCHLFIVVSFVFTCRH